MSTSNLYSNPVPIFTGTNPKEGAKALPVSFDWSVAATYNVDLTIAQNQARFSGIQAVFVDNSANNGAVVITTSALNQQLSVAAGWQGYFPLLVSSQMKLTVTSVGSVSSTIQLLNYPVPFGLWPANATPSVIANPLPVSDAALEALISGGRLFTQQIEAGCTETNRSGTITVGGSAQVVMAANATRRGFRIQNIDASLPTEEIWVRTTGAAAIAATGSFALAAYGAAGFPGGVFEGKSTQSISIIAATTGHKFSAVEW